MRERMGRNEEGRVGGDEGRKRRGRGREQGKLTG